MKKVDLVFNLGLHVAISPYYNIQNEYRVVVYKNKAVLIFDKLRKKS
jgi:hypothetical protein